MSQGPCEPDCKGYADYAAVPCPNPACDARVMARWAEARGETIGGEAVPA